MRDIPLDRGGLFKFGNFENRKGAAKPRPLCTPLGLFLVVQGIRCSYLLTCVCMLRYSAHYAVPMLFYFFTYSVVLFWQGVCILRYSVRYALRSLALNLRRGGAACHHQQPASPRRPFTNRSTTATTTSQPSSAAPMAQNLPSSHPNLSQPGQPP